VLRLLKDFVRNVYSVSELTVISEYQANDASTITNRVMAVSGVCIDLYPTVLSGLRRDHQLAIRIGAYVTTKMTMAT
jgi:hypothetical protein